MKNTLRQTIPKIRKCRHLLAAWRRLKDPAFVKEAFNFSENPQRQATKLLDAVFHEFLKLDEAIQQDLAKANAELDAIQRQLDQIGRRRAKFYV